MKIGEKTFFLEFAQIAYQICQKVIEPHRSKYSPKIYAQPQLLASLLIKQYLGIDYRGLEDTLASNPSLAKTLGFKERVPDYSTFQKFYDRMEVNLLDCLFDQVIQELKGPIEKSHCWAADSTGYCLTQASEGYLKSRWKKRKDSQYSQKANKLRKFSKHIFMVELKWLLLGSQQARYGPCGDKGELEPLIKRRKRWIKVKAIATDAGFDTMDTHRWVRSRLHAKDAIKIGVSRGDPKRIHPYRKRIRWHFPWTFYRQRSKAETIPSIIKRKFGNHILARKRKLRKRETLMLGCVYNIYRGLQLGFLWLFWVFS